MDVVAKSAITIGGCSRVVDICNQGLEAVLESYVFGRQEPKGYAKAKSARIGMTWFFKVRDVGDDPVSNSTIDLTCRTKMPKPVIDLAGAVITKGFEDSFMKDAISPVPPDCGQFRYLVQIVGDVGRCSQASHNRCVAEKVATEPEIPHASRSDQTKVLVPNHAWVVGTAHNHFSGLFDRIPEDRVKRCLACSTHVSVQSPRKKCSLVDGWGFPFGYTVHGIFLEPESVDRILVANAFEPFKEMPSRI